jgi:hypothetical protein
MARGVPHGEVTIGPVPRPDPTGSSSATHLLIEVTAVIPPARWRVTACFPECGVGSARVRHRVLERRDVRRAVEFEFAFVPGFLVVEAVLFHDQPTFLLAVAVAATALVALAVAWRGGARRRPHPTAFAVGVIIFAMGIAAAFSTEVIGSLMSGTFAVVVVGCAVGGGIAAGRARAAGTRPGTTRMTRPVPGSASRRRSGPGAEVAGRRPANAGPPVGDDHPTRCTTRA